MSKQSVVETEEQTYAEQRDMLERIVGGDINQMSETIQGIRSLIYSLDEWDIDDDELEIEASLIKARVAASRALRTRISTIITDMNRFLEEHRGKFAIKSHILARPEWLLALVPIGEGDNLSIGAHRADGGIMMFKGSVYQLVEIPENL